MRQNITGSNCTKVPNPLKLNYSMLNTFADRTKTKQNERKKKRLL